MTIPSRVLASGVNSMSTVAICGDSGIGLTATGTNAATAYQINRDFSVFTTSSVGSGAKLPPTEMGAFIVIADPSANNIVIYPYESTSTINGAASCTVKKDHTAIFYAVSNSAWYSMQGTFT